MTDKRTKLDPEHVRDLSEQVYKMRLGKEQLASMLEKEGEAKLREHAGSYDPLTRCYLKAIAGIE